MSNRLPVSYQDLEAFLDELDNEPGAQSPKVEVSDHSSSVYDGPSPVPDLATYTHPAEPETASSPSYEPSSSKFSVPSLSANSLGLSADELALLNSSQYSGSYSSPYGEIDLTTPRGMKLENDNLRIKMQLFDQQRDEYEMKLKAMELKNLQLETELKKALALAKSAGAGRPSAASASTSQVDDKLYNEMLLKLNRAEQEAILLKQQVAQLEESQASLNSQLTVAFSEHAAAEKELTATYEQLSERVTQLADTVAYADGLREELELERERSTEMELELIRLAPLKDGLSDSHEKWLDAEEKLRSVQEELAKARADAESAQSKLNKIMNLPGLANFNASSPTPIDLNSAAPPAADKDKKDAAKRGGHSRGPSAGGHSRNSSIGASSKAGTGGVTLKEGYLERFANKKAQKRYFVLKPTQLLSYKNDKADRDKPLGQMDVTLAQITILVEADAIKQCNEKYVFKLLDPASLNSFLLICSSESELKDWTDTIWKLNKAAQMSGASKPSRSSVRLPSAPLLTPSSGGPSSPPSGESSPLSPQSSATPPAQEKDSEGRQAVAEEKREKRKSVFKRMSSKIIGKNTVNSDKDAGEEKK